VHGKVIAGGLLLIWVCDLIIASEDAEFIDIGAGTQFMVNGSEWFSHPWELGIRKAKRCSSPPSRLAHKRRTTSA
jgi:enoyl-CoA hydratase